MRHSRVPHTKQAQWHVTSPRAWIAEGRVSHDRGQVRGSSKPALVIFAVSVRDSFSIAIEDRLGLMSEVAARFAHRVPSGVPSLWVFPGGYFGYSAARGEGRRLNFDTHRRIESGIRSRARNFPVSSLIAVGIDNGETQQVWVTARGRRRVSVSRITRGVSQLPSRRFRVDSVEVAFFICGEFTGSQTYQNGPFCNDGMGRACYLSDPVQQLRGCAGFGPS